MQTACRYRCNIYDNACRTTSAVNRCTGGQPLWAAWTRLNSELGIAEQNGVTLQHGKADGGPRRPDVTRTAWPGSQSSVAPTNKCPPSSLRQYWPCTWQEIIAQTEHACHCWHYDAPANRQPIVNLTGHGNDYPCQQHQKLSNASDPDKDYPARWMPRQSQDLHCEK